MSVVNTDNMSMPPALNLGSEKYLHDRAYVMGHWIYPTWWTHWTIFVPASAP